MKRLWCFLFGHDNIWALDPMRPGEHIVVCLTCRSRAYSVDNPFRVPSTSEGEGT